MPLICYMFTDVARCGMAARRSMLARRQAGWSGVTRTSGDLRTVDGGAAGRSTSIDESACRMMRLSRGRITGHSYETQFGRGQVAVILINPIVNDKGRLLQ